MLAMLVGIAGKGFVAPALMPPSSPLPPSWSCRDIDDVASDGVGLWVTRPTDSAHGNCTGPTLDGYRFWNTLPGYADAPARCGRFDDDDFTAKQMCCACGGGAYGPDEDKEPAWDLAAPLSVAATAEGVARGRGFPDAQDDGNGDLTLFFWDGQDAVKPSPSPSPSPAPSPHSVPNVSAVLAFFIPWQ